MKETVLPVITARRNRRQAAAAKRRFEDPATYRSDEVTLRTAPRGGQRLVRDELTIAATIGQLETQGLANGVVVRADGRCRATR